MLFSVTLLTHILQGRSGGASDQKEQEQNPIRPPDKQYLPTYAMLSGIEQISVSLILDGILHGLTVFETVLYLCPSARGDSSAAAVAQWIAQQYCLTL